MSWQGTKRTPKSLDVATGGQHSPLSAIRNVNRYESLQASIQFQQGSRGLSGDLKVLGVVSRDLSRAITVASSDRPRKRA